METAEQTENKIETLFGVESFWGEFVDLQTVLA